MEGGRLAMILRDVFKVWLPVLLLGGLLLGLYLLASAALYALKRGERARDADPGAAEAPGRATCN